jgi:hypothetical protein
MSKQFCKYNHDTFEVGRSPDGHCMECRRQCYWNNKVYVTAYQKEYIKTHKKERKKREQVYYEKNKNELLMKRKEYVKSHRKEINDRRTIKLATNLNFKLACSLRSRLIHAINGNFKAGSAVRDLGCSIDFLKQYIESKFYSNMTWDNWGDVWELDHIKRLAEFDLTDVIQFKEAVHYTNLQPLTIEDHYKKSSAELRRK